jgi:hypothetical protein
MTDSLCCWLQAGAHLTPDVERRLLLSYKLHLEKQAFMERGYVDLLLMSSRARQQA